jgi:hypothetical protein
MEEWRFFLNNRLWFLPVDPSDADSSSNLLKRDFFEEGAFKDGMSTQNDYAKDDRSSRSELRL